LNYVPGELRTVAAEGFSNTRFLTVSEVAEVMRLSRMTVYRLVKAHDLPAVRFGRSYRVPEHAIEDYVQHHSTLADDEHPEAGKT
jgi:excisionase family DNA binding protein